MNPVLSLQAVGKAFEPGAPVLHDVSLHIEPGAIVCLLGPSGCGKTTLLRLVAGFEEPDTGAIHLGGQPVSRPGYVVAPEKRRIGMVFQDYALFPHMTVSQNILFGLFRRPASHRNRRLADLLQLVGLEDMAERYPHELSGGQQQRVAWLAPWRPTRNSCCSTSRSATWTSTCAASCGRKCRRCCGAPR